MYGGGRELRPIVAAQEAGTQLARVDPRLAAQETIGELLLRHFQGEEHRRRLAHAARIQRDVQREGRLTHGGAAGDDDQIARVHAGRHLVEPLEAGGQAGDVLLQLRGPRDRFEGANDYVRNVLVRAAQAMLGDVEDRALGLVEELLHRAVVAVPERRSLVTGHDQAPDDRLFAHDLGVGFDVRHRGDGVGEREQVLVAADRVQAIAGREPLAQRHRVDWLARREQLRHRLEDARVRVAVEIIGAERDLEHHVERVVLEQHPAEHRAFGAEVVRWNAARARGRSSVTHGSPRVTTCERTMT